jgi:EmrB/QacA subfamily drug resistance transporter
MAFIDGTVVNVALPAIQRDLQARAFEAQWVVESYALFLAALLLVGGSLGDRFGRRRLFVIGVGLFSGASIACALSGNVGHLIAARGLQGVGAALLVPGSLALISASFPEAERGRAIGTWSAFSGMTAALGPVMGGWLIEHYTWRWAFLLNVPVGFVVCGLAWLQVPESRGSARGPIDSLGALSATLGLAGIVYALIEGPSRGWGSTTVLGALVGGAAMSSVFVRIERRQPAPMLPLRLFRIHNFAGANLLTLLLYAALSGALFFFPLNLIQVQGYSATAAGAALLPLILVMFLLSRWAGALVDRLGAKLPLVVGPSIAALGFALFARPTLGGSYWSTFFPAVIVLGFGMSITVAPLTTTVMNSVSQDLAGTASGVNNAVSRAAGLLAIAVFGILMTSAFEASLKTQLAALRVGPELTALLWEQRSKLAGMRVPAQVDAVAAASLTRAVRLAFVTGFRWVMGLSVALALLSALSAWLAIDGKRPAASAT